MFFLNRRMLLRRGIAGAATVLMNKYNLLAQSPGRTSLKRNNRIRQSVSRWCYNEISLDRLCSYGAEIGLKGIDLLQPEEYELPGRYGLICTMGYAGGGEINKGLNRIENHADIEAGLRKYIPLAAKAGVPNVVTFSGNRDGLSDEEGARNTVIGLKKIRSMAEDHGVIVCIELLNSKVDHHGYMCDHTAWGVHVVEEVASPNIKLLYDIYHMQIMEGDLIATIRQNKKWIGHFHTGGVPGRHELNGSQEVRWDAVMKAIADTGFNGYVAHEFVPTADPFTSLREAVDLCDI
jgi:hydroxypyruvate isomerase